MQLQLKKEYILMQGRELEIWNEIDTKTTPKLTSVEAPKEGTDAADCIRNRS